MKKLIGIVLILVMTLSLITITQAADFNGSGYNFVCADGGRYLNVYAGKDADGTNVCVWEKDGSPEQNYTIRSCGGGKYKLYPQSSSSRVIDVNRGNSYNNPLKAGLNVDLWKTNDAPAQEFYITHVGNNLYKIELAALPGHVLQANNPNRNNGNVTLEKYTGANNQLWKILKNGTPVTEPCTHSNVSSKNEKTSYAQKNDTAHTVIKTYDKVCNNCGKTIETNVKETKNENHSISNHKCLTCGYEVVVPQCTHAKTYEAVKSSLVTPKNNTAHTVTDIFDVYCSDCKEQIKKDVTKTYDEKHTIHNNRCDKCSYAVPGSEVAKCQHAHTAKHMSETLKSATSIKDDNQHTTVTYYNLYCTDCQTYIEENIPEFVDEDHHFVNNICSACNLERIVEKPASATIRVAKTTFTPEESIPLTWTVADRATSYDIHIEIPGVDTPYRIDSDFSGTSGTVVIKDEGTYRLTIYPINSAGYTRGESVEITVKQASAEKTATVKDGLYSIKNVSSGYRMNIYAGKDANGTKVTMWENDNSNDQKVYIAHQGNGKYLLKYNASKNNRVIDVNRGNSMTASIDEGDKIDIWTSNDPEAQLFYINDCGNGKFTFELVSKPEYVIAPTSAAAAKTNGNQLELKKDVNTDYQKWYIVSTAVQENTNIASASELKSKYQSIVDYVGYQTKKAYANYSSMCGCYATAYAHTYLSGKTHRPSEYWKSETNATTYWVRAGGTRTVKSNDAQVLAAAKSEMDKGRPCIVRVNSRQGGHYVLVISYTGSGNKPSDFTVVDPWDGKFKSLSNFTIHYTEKQVVFF